MDFYSPIEEQLPTRIMEDMTTNTLPTDIAWIKVENGKDIESCSHMFDVTRKNTITRTYTQGSGYMPFKRDLHSLYCLRNSYVNKKIFAPLVTVSLTIFLASLICHSACRVHQMILRELVQLLVIVRI